MAAEHNGNGRVRHVRTDDTKAAVVAALLAGQSVTQVAAAYNLPVGTVKDWSANLKPRETTAVATSKKSIGELLICYLEVNLNTLRAQAEAFSDPVWLAKQSASDAAILHGVMTDKAVRLLEALGGPYPVAP